MEPPVRLSGFTPSSFPRLAKCLGSVVLPKVDEELPQMARGTEGHSFLERIANGATPAESLAKVADEWREDCAAVELGGLPPLTSGLAEVGLLLDVDAGTARVVLDAHTREAVNAARLPHETGMLVDWMAQEGEGRGVVLDWKFSRSEQIARAAVNLQIRTYAATALMAYGWSEVRYGLIRVDGDRPRWDMAEMDWLEAQEVLEEVRALRAAALAALEAHAKDGALPPLRLGPWCDWCPAARQCPARVKGVLALMDGTAQRSVDEAKAGAMTPAQAGELFSRLMAALDAGATMVKDLKLLAAQVPGGFPLPSGKVLAEVEKREASPDPERVVEVLTRLYGEDAARHALVQPPPKTSWTHLKAWGEAHVLPERQRAFDENRGGKRGRRPSAGTVATELRTMLEAAGAVKVSHWVEVREVSPESKALTGALAPELGEETGQATAMPQSGRTEAAQ